MSRYRHFLGSACILLHGLTLAQSGTNDDTFNAGDLGFGMGDGPNGTVTAIVEQADGRVVISGNFTTYNGVDRRCIARLNADGSLDPTFDPGEGFYPFWGRKHVIVQADGAIIVAGNFEAFDGNVANGIVRLTADGAFDSSFDTGSGFNDDPQAVALQSDGKILVAGSFTVYNGQLKPQLLRLETNGQIDPTFNIGIGIEPSQFDQIYISSIQLTPDQHILVGGKISSYNGSACNDLIRLDPSGALDLAFGTGAGIFDEVHAFVQLPDGGVVLALENVLNQVNSDGTLGAPLNVGAGFAGDIHNLLRQPDGKLLAQGTFIAFNGVSRRGIVRLEEDGSLDASFVPPAPPTFYEVDNEPLAMTLAADGGLLVGGGIQLLKGTGRRYFARLDLEGGIDDDFLQGTGCSDEALAVALQPDGKIIVGGRFAYFNGVRCDHLVRLQTDGTVDPSFQPVAGINRAVTALALQPDGKIIAAGNFYTIDGPRVIVRLNDDGSMDPSFSPPDELLNFNPGNLPYFDWIYDVILQPDGKILVNGFQFNPMRLNADGSIDGTFAADWGGPSMALQPDGKLLIGYTSIHRLNTDGSDDPTFAGGYLMGPPLTPAPHGIWLLPNGKVIIAGDFAGYMGTPTSEVIRVNSDGTLDETFQAPEGIQVRTLIARPNGQLLCAGIIGDPFEASTLFLLNEDGSVDMSLGFDAIVGFGQNNYLGTVGVLAEHADGKLVVGGDFVQYNGTGRNRLARVNADISTDIRDEFHGELQLRPNPSTGEVFVNLPEGSSELWIADITGRTVQSHQLRTSPARELRIDLSGQEDGVYLVSARSGAQTFTQRVVKH